jgi:molybdopterin synthase sulfur carrier subunit
MITVLYFARLREALGCASERIALPAGVASVGALRDHLAARGGAAAALAGATVRVAVNQVMAGPATPVADGDEVAFFPPVTGG